MSHQWFMADVWGEHLDVSRAIKIIGEFDVPRVSPGWVLRCTCCNGI
ncbi:hypothetical protein [Synechococcus sp. MIT S9504]|nr:hypothetical protein [Synechococcus sp. MIT S9504]